MDMTIEEFLYTKGKPIPETTKWKDIPEGWLPVELIDNGHFTCAVLGYDEREFERFIDKSDGRPFERFIVLKEDLEAVTRNPWDKE